ncbi:MAG: TIGR01777 family oxidoreductase [Bacteroidetes bacterium]|nr:TIGR01777 family oxidoreductase [Bacteroidota bacterium]
MNILITGGTGFIGSRLVKHLVKNEHQVTILTRSEKSSSNRYITYKKWDAQKMPIGMGLYDAVINLAGASIAANRWTDEYKKVILDSRMGPTQACVKFINSSPNPPKVFLSASAVGYYGVKKEGEIDEKADPGDDFAAEVCKKWEDEANKAQTRTVNMRIGVVLGKGGGALDEMGPIYKLGLGGRFASGKQGFPWVHLNDLIKAMDHFLHNEDTSGPFNLVGPELVNQATFSKQLASALHRPEIFVVPKFALDMMFGERSLLFWGGQFPLVDKLKTSGFEFQFPKLKEALEDVVS